MRVKVDKHQIGKDNRRDHRKLNETKNLIRERYLPENLISVAIILIRKVELNGRIYLNKLWEFFLWQLRARQIENSYFFS